MWNWLSMSAGYCWKRKQLFGNKTFLFLSYILTSCIFWKKLKQVCKEHYQPRFIFFWCFLSQSTITKTVLNDRINDGVKHYQMSIFSSNAIIGKNNKNIPFSCFAIDCGFFYRVSHFLATCITFFIFAVHTQKVT